MRITVGSMKGGVAKTTTAVYLALGLAKHPRHGRVLLVDADPEQSSAYQWSVLAGEAWPAAVTVIPWATRDLGRRVREVADDYSHVVLDTGPKNPALLRQALSVSDRFVIPVSPRPLDLAELPATLDVAAEVENTHPLRTIVLLVQVRAGTRSAAETRALLSDDLQFPVFRAQIGLRESYSLAHGTVPDSLAEYDYVLQEMGVQ